MRVITLVLLLLGLALPLSAQDDEPHMVGRVTIPYLFGDAGMVAVQAGATLPVTWENAPEGALIYILLWRSNVSGIPSLIGIDIDASDGVSVQWKIPERLSGMPYGVALYADGGREISDNRRSGLEYGSGIAPPEGICSVSASPNAPEVFAYASGGQLLGYLNDYAPALERVVDSDGFPWIRIDLSQPDIVAPIERGLALPEIGWIYAHGTRLFGDCGFLESDG